MSIDIYSLDEFKSIVEEAGYPVDYAQNRMPTDEDVVELPKVFVGYNTVSTEHPTTPRSMSPYEQKGEGLVQTFVVQIHCTVADFKTIYDTLYNTIVTRNTKGIGGLNTEISGYAYAGGGVIGLAQGNLHWQDIWFISFPTI